jgi:hypothetical protein
MQILGRELKFRRIQLSYHFVLSVQVLILILEFACRLGVERAHSSWSPPRPWIVVGAGFWQDGHAFLRWLLRTRALVALARKSAICTITTARKILLLHVGLVSLAGVWLRTLAHAMHHFLSFHISRLLSYAHIFLSSGPLSNKQGCANYGVPYGANFSILWPCRTMDISGYFSQTSLETQKHALGLGVGAWHWRLTLYHSRVLCLQQVGRGKCP